MAHSAVSPMAVSREPGFADTSVKNEAPSSGVSWPAVVAGAFCSCRVVADPARIGHGHRLVLHFAVVKHGRIGLRYEYRRYRLADRHANHRRDVRWVSGGPITHEVGEYSHRRSIFP